MNSDITTVISNPWSLSAEEILERSNVTREKGFDKKQTKVKIRDNVFHRYHVLYEKLVHAGYDIRSF